MSSEAITRNDLENVLNEVLSPPPLKTRYFASSSKTIATAGVDATPTVGATVTLPAGHVYFILGQWTFNSGSSSAARNNQIVIRETVNGVNRATQRVLYANQSFGVLQVAYLTDKLTTDTVFGVCASSSMTYTTASDNRIYAIPID